jgi:hypothetical protein
MKVNNIHRNAEWLFFNIHNLVGMRVQSGHASQRSIRLAFGPFETESLERIDLTLQYEPPEIGEHSFASESYLFTNRHVYIKNYKLHLVNQENGCVLASNRDLLPFVMPVIQWLLLKKQHSFVHGAAVAIKGQGILLPGWGGTGKTSAIICLLKEVPDTSFLGDDYSIVSDKGRLLSFPKAFFIYPYHRNLFPHLFKIHHKPLVPPFLSGLLERVRTVVRPAVMALPRLESFARRITPEHMQVPAHTAIPNAVFVDNVPLDSILFVERYSGTKSIIDKLGVSEAKRQLIGNWNYEQGRCAVDLILGAGGTGVLDLEAYYSRMSLVLEKALSNRCIYRLRMGAMTPAETGKTIVEAIRETVLKRG